MFRTVLIVLTTMVLLSLAAHAQTVDEIIAKNVRAHGGMDKMKAVNTIRVSGKVNSGSFQAAALQEKKRPEKVREEFTIQGLTQVQAYDGKTGWAVSPFEGRRDPQLLSQDDLKGLEVAADMDGPLVDYKQKGHKAELMGHDSVEGTDCFKIKLTLKNGDVRNYYLDTDSYLELKLETQTMIRGAVQESETYYGDYEEVNGLYYPFAFEIGQKGWPNRVKYTVEKIDLNVPLDDSLFSMPVTKPDARTPVAVK